MEIQNILVAVCDKREVISPDTTRFALYFKPP